MLSRALVVFLAVCGPAVAEDGRSHVALVVGTLHYSPDLSVPPLAPELQRFGFRTTVVQGEGDPEKKTVNVLPGIEVLDEADVAVFFARFLKLPDDKWVPIENYLKSGKPVIGLRTANHSFRYDKSHPRFAWNDGFGRRALGTPYVAHQRGTTPVSVVARNRTHPVLSHLPKSRWTSPGSLYITRLEGGVIPLLTGIGEGKARLLERDFGPVQISELEADIVAWAWKNEWGGEVFATTLGHPGDFAEESFVRMLINAVHWAAGRAPPGPDAEISTWEVRPPN